MVSKDITYKCLFDFASMQRGHLLSITPIAGAELCRQAAFAGTPGSMHLDLVTDTCDEGWLHIRLRPGKYSGVPIARTDGVTVYVPQEQLEIFKGLHLSYFGDLSGGGFLITVPVGSEGCACGAGFRSLS